MKKIENTVYQKHLTLLDREDIEKLLKEDYKLYQIAERLRKDSTTISKEIKRHRIEHKPSTFNHNVNYCKNKDNCHKKNLCNSNCHTECRRCGKCNSICSEYKMDICEKLEKSPYVCNSCKSYNGCRRMKYLYSSQEAQKQYENIKISSREGINLSEEELRKLDALISPLIKQGQSIKNIYRNHKNEIPCKISSLYNYIDMRLLSARNIDLPRRVKYKVRDKKINTPKTDKRYKIGRTYEDFLEFIEKKPHVNVVEMDTVEGEKGRKVLLTLIFRNCNFMIAKLMPDKTSNSVKNKFDKLEKLMGIETFKRLFECILTDNGSEFQKPEELENSGNEKRCNIFYCEPNRADQKGKIEKNHEYVRYIIPKGTSMDKYEQKDIDLMMSHINSTAREILNFAIPYDMARVYFGDKIIENLNISKIQPDDIILKPYLINKKK